MNAASTTGSMASGERIEQWRERVLDLFGVEYRIEPEAGAPFFIDIGMGGAESLAVLHIHGSAHRAIGQSNPGNKGKLLVHLQLAGHCTVKAEGREVFLDPGSLSLFPIRETTDLQFHDSYEQICAVLPVGLLTGMVPGCVRHMVRRIPAQRGIAAILSDHLISLSRHRDTLELGQPASLINLSMGMIGALLQELFGTEKTGKSANADASGMKAYHLERIKQFALVHLANPALNINLIAKGVGLSSRYIHHIFNDETLSLMQWILKERLYRCHAELSRGMASVRTICDLAYSWGFNDQAHFSNCFRRQFGISPSELRRRGSGDID